MEEETLSLIFKGCKLARDLESNLPYLSNQPKFLSNSCDEIIRAFKMAVDRINTHNASSYDPHMAFGESRESQTSEIAVGVHEWLTSSFTQAMGLLQAQTLAERNPYDVQLLPKRKMGITESPESGAIVIESGATYRDYVNVEGSKRLRSSGGEFQAMDEPDSGRSSGSQRSRKRKDSVEKQTVMVPALRIGNTEIPHNDDFTWRKYGQKDILGSKFPRSYYRCTHKNFYGCEAKKQVQRLEDDPNTLEVNYYGKHSCHMSSMAPCVTVPVAPRAPLPSASIPMSRWLSMEFEPSISREDANTRMQMYNEFGCISGAAGPSNVRDRKEVEYPVVNLADAMFNSGSSSNSLDAIFPSMKDKWEPGDKSRDN